MTLHLGATSAGGFAHVSDRRLTVHNNGGAPSVTDPEANKAIVVSFPRFTAVIGNVGVAHSRVSRRPMDHVLAEAVVERELSAPTWMSGWSPTRRSLDLWWVADRIGRRLDDEMSDFTPQQRASTAAFIVGVHLRGMRSIPFAWSVHGTARGPAIGRTRLDYEDALRFQLHAAGSGSHLAGREWRRVREALGPVSDLAEARNRMIQVVQRVAAVEATVGTDAMAILGRITPGRADVDVMYVADGTTEREPDAMFSPWVITPGGVQGPALVVGNTPPWNLSSGSPQHLLSLAIKGAPAPPHAARGDGDGPAWRTVLSVRSQPRRGPLGQLPTER